MNAPGFQVFCDSNGDLYVVDGMVAQLRTGVRLATGAGRGFSGVDPGPTAGFFALVNAAPGATFVGGSGRNLVATGLTPPASGSMPPVGLFSPGEPDVFRLGEFVLTVAGSSAATITDGTDTVAVLSTGGTAPEGDYVATAYGETTYHGGAAFTIAVALEIAGGGAIPDRRISVNAGTLPTGDMTASSSILYALGSDPDLSIQVNSDGTADLKYSGTVIATREAASSYDPDGRYVANEDGKIAANAGEDWTATVMVSPRLPRAGFVYLTVTEAAGVLVSVSGPDFAAALPADTATEFHVALAQCDGAAIEQFHTGMLVWPEP